MLKILANFRLCPKEQTDLACPALTEDHVAEGCSGGVFAGQLLMALALFPGAGGLTGMSVIVLRCLISITV